MTACTRILIGLVLLPLPAPAYCGDWAADPAVAARLAAGQVVVAASTASDQALPRGSVRAAVRIDASPEAIWRVMTDCRQAAQFVPGLMSCRRLGGAADGSWEDIEHQVRYSHLLPSVRYVFRAAYQRPYRIDTRRISGDLKEEEGTWLLMPSADGTATVVEYQVYIDPGFWVPQALVRRSLRKDLPAALNGLRERVERPESHERRPSRAPGS